MFDVFFFFVCGDIRIDVVNFNQCHTDVFLNVCIEVYFDLFLSLIHSSPLVICLVPFAETRAPRRASAGTACFEKSMLRHICQKN